MGWLRLVGSFQLQISFAEQCLFNRALLQNIVSFIGLFGTTDLCFSFPSYYYPLYTHYHFSMTNSPLNTNSTLVRSFSHFVFTLNTFFFFGFYEKGIASRNVLGYPLSIIGKNSPLNTNSILNQFLAAYPLFFF